MDETPALPLNLNEYEAAARALLPPMAFDYIAGGAEDEVTLRENRAAFDRWRLLPRVLRGLGAVSTATTVLGQKIALPVVIAPSGFHRLAHEAGERATARAARAAGTIYTMSHRRQRRARGGGAGGRTVVVPALLLPGPGDQPRPGRAGGGGRGLGAGRHRRRAGAGAARGGRAQPLHPAAGADDGQRAGARVQPVAGRGGRFGVDQLRRRRRLGAGAELEPTWSGWRRSRRCRWCRRGSSTQPTRRGPSTTERGR